MREQLEARRDQLLAAYREALARLEQLRGALALCNELLAAPDTPPPAMTAPPAEPEWRSPATPDRRGAVRGVETKPIGKVDG